MGCTLGLVMALFNGTGQHEMIRGAVCGQMMCGERAALAGPAIPRTQTAAAARSESETIERRIAGRSGRDRTPEA